MKHMVALAARFRVVVYGYLVASAVAGFYMAIWFLPYAMMKGGVAGVAFSFLFLPLIICVAVIYIVAVTAIPTMVFITIAEAYQVDSVLPYVAFAVIMALFVFALSGHWRGGEAAFFCASLLIAGYAAGCVYWELAGQMAGEGCEPR